MENRPLCKRGTCLKVPAHIPQVGSSDPVLDYVHATFAGIEFIPPNQVRIGRVECGFCDAEFIIDSVSGQNLTYLRFAEIDSCLVYRPLCPVCGCVSMTHDEFSTSLANTTEELIHR